jgi:formamidopyrimidine-DNA glycosylase
MGGRVSLIADEGSLPKKHHLLVAFDDGSYLAVAMQMWGFANVTAEAELGAHWALAGISPMSAEFTYDAFKAIMDRYEAPEKNSAKAFLVQRPTITGIGNGYAQDILFRARIHPTRKVATIPTKERRQLDNAIKSVLKDAVRLGGRDTERDLFGKPGRYVPTLDKRALGKPCPACGTTVQKIQFLGGAAYFGASCQT